MMDNSHSINREGPEDARTTSRKLTYVKCHNIITCTWGKGNICWKKQWNTNTISFHAFCEEPWGKERNVCIFHAATVLCSPTCWHFDLFIHQLLIFACWLYKKTFLRFFMMLWQVGWEGSRWWHLNYFLPKYSETATGLPCVQMCLCLIKPSSPS